MKQSKMRFAVSGLLLLAIAIATAGVAEAQTYTTTSTTIVGMNNVMEGRDLTVGTTGSDVAFLQGLLIELGYLNVPPGIPLGYFGGLTRAAVAAYQTSQGVISTGYYGPLTKQAMRGHFATRGWLRLLFPGFYQG